MYGRSYRNYEEFEREELRRMDRIEVTCEELLAEFDNDSKSRRKKKKKQGLFDAYDEESEDYFDFG